MLFRSSSCGTYNSNNTGSIVIETSDGFLDLMQIAAGEGQSQFAGFTVATATTAYLLGAFIQVDSTQAADIRLFKRETFNDTSVPVEAQRIQLYLDGVDGQMEWTPRSPIKFDALTDIWWEAQGSGGATSVSIDFELLIVDD